MAQRIVVTGGSGQLGQHVIHELLDYDYDVLSLDRVAPPSDRCPSRLLDLTQSEDVYRALERADGVVHLGAYQAPAIAPDTETFANNVTAVYNLLHGATRQGIRRVVLASSTAAFGFLYAHKPFLPDYLPLDEKHPCRPQDPYGLSKVVGERIADSFAAGHDISICSLRFPGVHFDLSYQTFAGRWQDSGAKLGRLWSYIDARDAAAACRLAVEKDLHGHEALIAAAPTSTVREPTDDLMRRHFPDVKKARPELTGNWSGVDSSRARKLLGFVAKHVWENHLP